MPLTGIAAAGIAAGATLAGGTAGIIANSNMNKKNRKWQEKMTKEARSWQEKMYNQYNSPHAQAQQLASAGVNPYNQGGASTTPMSTSTSVPSPSSTPYDFGFVGEAADKAIGHIQNAPVMKAQSLANEETEVRIEGMRTDNRIKLYDEMMKAIDAGNYEYAQMLNNERIREDIRTSKASRKEKLQSRKNMEKQFDILVEEHKEKQLNNGMLNAFVNDGGNTFKDNHDKIMQDISSSLNSMINDNIRLDLQIASSKLDDELKHINIKNASVVLNDISRLSNISSLVEDNLNIPYSTLPPYLQTMAAGLVLASNKVNSYDYDTVGDYKSAKSKLDTLKSDFETYYLDYLKNSADKLHVDAGNVSNQKYFETIIDILK